MYRGVESRVINDQFEKAHQRAKVNVLLLSSNGDQLNNSQGVEVEVEGKRKGCNVGVSISMDGVGRQVNTANTVKGQVAVAATSSILMLAVNGFANVKVVDATPV